MLLQNLHACKFVETAFRLCSSRLTLPSLKHDLSIALAQSSRWSFANKKAMRQPFEQTGNKHLWKWMCHSVMRHLHLKNGKYAHWDNTYQNKTCCPLSPHCTLPSCFSKLTCWTNESVYGWGGMQSSQSLSGMKQEYCQESCLLCMTGWLKSTLNTASILVSALQALLQIDLRPRVLAFGIFPSSNPIWNFLCRLKPFSTLCQLNLHWLQAIQHYLHIIYKHYISFKHFIYTYSYMLCIYIDTYLLVHVEVRTSPQGLHCCVFWVDLPLYECVSKLGDQILQIALFLGRKPMGFGSPHI